MTLPDFSHFTALEVASICSLFLVSYTALIFKVGEWCERQINPTHWRLIAYIPAVLLFFAGFIMALILFSSQKVVVIGLFFSYNIIKIVYGVYKSMRFSSKMP
jgi:hypothetical protein